MPDLALTARGPLDGRVAAFANVSVTPMRSDLTNHSVLESLQNWNTN